MADDEPISVIIPTTAEARRGATLMRALDSLRAQKAAMALPIVVVNGDRSDAAVVDYLAACPDIVLVRREAGNLPRAIAAGREQVTTRYFGVLDDDDEYLPDALAVRRAPLDADDSLDAVVTNGMRASAEGEDPYFTGLAGYAADPLGALARVNWLASCGGLFRTRTVGSAPFLAMPRYFEWTYMAVWLALRGHLAFIDQPCFRVHVATEESLSKSVAYNLGAVQAIEAIRALDLPEGIRQVFDAKHLASMHNASVFQMKSANYRDAWLLHLRTLTRAGGWRYLPFTGRLALSPLLDRRDA